MMVPNLGAAHAAEIFLCPIGRSAVQAVTQDSIKAKLKRGTFPATFLLACLAALELSGISLEDV
jgi:hypothetical protein